MVFACSDVLHFWFPWCLGQNLYLKTRSGISVSSFDQMSLCSNSHTIDLSSSASTMFVHLSICWFVCVCVCVADNESPACRLWFQSKAAWAAHQRAALCIHKQNALRSLHLFPRLSLIGYLLPMGLIHILCRGGRRGNINSSIPLLWTFSQLLTRLTLFHLVGDFVQSGFVRFSQTFSFGGRTFRGTWTPCTPQKSKNFSHLIAAKLQ